MSWRTGWSRSGLLALVGAGVCGLGLAGVAAAEGPAGRPPPHASVVVDSAGRVVGAVQALTFPTATLGLRLGGQVYAVQVGRDRFTGASDVLGFEFDDCRAPAWLIAPGSSDPSRLHPLAGLGPQNVLHGVGGALETRTIVARWFPPAVPACAPQAAASTAVYPTVELLDLDTFLAPFRLE